MSDEPLTRQLDEGPKEECGVFGIWAPGEDVARLTFFGLFALQHRGQESAGIAVSDGQQIRSHKEMGLVTQVFDEDVLSSLPGHVAIGHTRYSTTGSSILRNAQPLCCTSFVGSVAVAHNGNLINAAEMRREMEARGIEFETTNDSEVIARMIGSEETEDTVEAVRRTMKKIRGAYSLAILTENGLVAARDPYGVRPLCLGRINGHYHVIASENCALNVVGAEFVREIEPGEIVAIGPDGLREEQGVPLERHATCMFEFIYFARPDSSIYDRTLYFTRRRMGHVLAKEQPAPGANLVIPIPDSAVPAAIGYAEASRIPYGEGLVKNRYIQRTFIQPDQRMRDLGARMKYTPLREALAGKRVVMVDDSIVRGTTTGKLVRLLFEAGALEVHVRITAPPIQWPCFYGIDMANQEELIAAQHSIEEIREQIGATSLGYLSIEGLTRAVGLKRDKFCLACFDGRYPIHIPKSVRVSKLALEHNAVDPDTGDEGVTTPDPPDEVRV